MSFNVTVTVPPVTNLVGHRGVKSVLLTWDRTGKQTKTEVWASNSNTFDTATKIGSTATTTTFLETDIPDVTRYYWVRVATEFSAGDTKYSTLANVSVTPEGISTGGTGTIADGSVTEAKLSNGAVSALKLASGATGNSSTQLQNNGTTGWQPTAANGAWQSFGQFATITPTYAGEYIINYVMDAGLACGGFLPGDHAICQFQVEIRRFYQNTGGTEVIVTETSRFAEHWEPEVDAIPAPGSSYHNGNWMRTIRHAVAANERTFYTLNYRTDVYDANGDVVTTRGTLRPIVYTLKNVYQKRN